MSRILRIGWIGRMDHTIFNNHINPGNPPKSWFRQQMIWFKEVPINKNIG
jgi:hypothetical protein